MTKKKEGTKSGSRPELKRRKLLGLPEIALLTEDDLYLFNEGTHFRLYEKLGAHPLTVNEQEGTYFAVWAPDARQVSVAGDFNNWDRASHPLQPRGHSGILEGFIPGIGKGANY